MPRKTAAQITEEANAPEKTDDAPKPTKAEAAKFDNPRLGPTGSKNYRMVKGERVYV